MADQRPKKQQQQQQSPVQRKAEARREEKLELIRQQVKDGSLVIRKMTAAERTEFPAKPPRAKKPRR
ncbi:MAG: hypothetical protein QOJ55_2692 [Solirubrobacteraceae bacterium]|jgi:hypothetical protein|nr:hypothetical protein [Solirubrobacteraceae bacterium]MDX6674259.1 hypothetical protein [Solirubrobacteraceae bacterium]